MKNLIITLSTTLVIVLTALVSCQDQGGVSASSAGKLDRGSEIARIYGGNLFSEKVTFSQDGDGNLVGTFNTKKENKTFTLQKEKNQNIVLPKPGQYEVLYLKHILILNNLINGERYLLTVSNEESNKITHDIPSSYIKNVNVLNGFGLSMSTKIITAGARVLDGCASAGGRGSVSCSNVCCSVTCSGGYYATCGNTCNCVKS